MGRGKTLTILDGARDGNAATFSLAKPNIFAQSILLPSGLMGPVRLVSFMTITVKLNQ